MNIFVAEFELFFAAMKNRKVRWIYYVLVKCLLITPLIGHGQELLQPLRGKMLLSGNFGELRATHFHSGIDIKTGGREGLPVLCVADGVAARVAVSPTGYGHALYIEHADGTTTVYGHLQRFEPRLAALVREMQYARESFKIDEDIRSYGMAYKRGDTIAYSGNSGSSGGPHLHFEVRNTATEHTYNPLRYFRMEDGMRPVVRSLYLYSVSEAGQVCLLRSCPVKRLAAGKYDAGQYTVPAGNVGVGVFATDYMEGSWNKLGIYRLALVSGQDTLYAFSVDSCSFGHSRLINEVKDFRRYKKQETVYRCFGLYQEGLFGTFARRNGFLQVEQDSVVEVSVALSDINGNVSRIRLVLKGGEPVGETAGQDSLLHYGAAHVLQAGNWRVELDSCALFSSVPRVCEAWQDTLVDAPILRLADEDVPLLIKGRLFLQGMFSSRALICELTADGRRHPVETRHEPGGLAAEIGYLSCYTVAEDTVAPEAVYLGKVAGGMLRFRIKDDFSGIVDYRCEVNGAWCLAAYDPKRSHLECSLAEPSFRRGETNVVRIVVVDGVGNRKELSVKVTK